MKKGKLSLSELNTGKSRLAMSIMLALAGTQSVSAQDAEIEEITITGSRIERSGMTTPTPVTNVNSEELSAMAPGNLVEGIGALPQFLGNQTINSPDSWFTRGGYGVLNMRGLGINRTLTLLNGRRMISSTAFGGVDVNLFPEAMIRSVETVTGGASAAYGTDAVAGVTNFLMDTDYVGFSAHAQTSTTAEGDADNYEASIAWGMDIGDRGHIQVGLDSYESDGVLSYKDRDWYQAWGTVPVGGVLQVVPNVVSRNATFDGLISAPGTSIHGLAFDRNANTSPFVTSDVSGFPLAIPPARHSITNGGSGDDLGADRPVVTPDNDRTSLFIYGDYDVADNFSVFGQFMQGTNKTSRWNTPGGSFHGTPTALTVFQDNAFLPDDLRQTMVDEGIDSFTFKRMGALEDTGGQSQIWDENEMTSITVGFNWDIEGGALDGWSVDAYYQDGQNERRWYQHGLRVDRIHAAFDAVVDPGTGNTVCRVSLFGDAFPGCEPINLFGRGNASPEALDYVMGYEAGQTITTPLFFADTGYDLGQSTTYTSGIAKTYNTDIDQQLLEISANGEIFQNWGPGPISLAVGYTNREEEILQIVHAPTTNTPSDHTNFRPVSCDDESIGLRGVSVPDCLNTVGMQYSKVSNIQGTIEVDEIFAETLIPLINGGDAIESVNLSLATRWADYSGSGEVWAYKGGLDIQVNDELRLRSTYSRDVRAANLSERFDKTGGVATIMDPQFGGATYNVTRFSGGNPLVEPEEADTFTAGFVYQPVFLDGFSMSIDWYDIEIDGAIGQLGVQAVIDQCEAGAQNLCSLITRNPDDNLLVLVGDVFVNVDQSIVQGVDMEFTYRTDVDWIGGDAESIGFRLFGSYLGERSEKNAGAPKIDRAGQTGIQQSDGAAYALPEWRWTGNVTYDYGPFSAFLQGRYIGEGVNENSLVEGVDISDNGVDSAFYLDLNVRYLHEMRSGATVELFGNVTNLTNEDPPVTPYFSAFTGYVTQANTLLFDVLGRRYTAGVRVNF